MGGVQVLDYGGTGDPGFLTEGGHSTFLLVYGPQPAGFDDPLADSVDRTVRAAARERGLTAAVTGYNQLSAGDDTGGDQGLSVLGETLVGALGALPVLVFVFASFLALLPLLIAGVSILATFLVVLGLTTFTEVSFVVQFLIALVGLGVAIDYSLLVVSRWREERARGRSNDEAVVTAVATAGRAVLASGITVAISLVALVVVDVPLIRSMGFGGMVIPVISTLVVLTLLPVLLSLVGPRVDRPRIRRRGTPPGPGRPGRGGRAVPLGRCGGSPVPRSRWPSSRCSGFRSASPVPTPWPARVCPTTRWRRSAPAGWVTGCSRRCRCWCGPARTPPRSPRRPGGWRVSGWRSSPRSRGPVSPRWSWCPGTRRWTTPVWLW
ncbi:MMPL family transporter [Streptomyces kaempferi]